MNNTTPPHALNTAHLNNRCRWFFLMNIATAVLVVSAVFLLKESSLRYKPGSAFDTAYISKTEKETNPKTLQHGILHTEAVRAHAYRSILRQSQGTFVFGLILALAFTANSIFIYSTMKNQGGTAVIPTD